MKNIFLYFGILMLSSCQIGQYYTAKTLEKGEKQILLGGESYVVPVGGYLQKNGLEFLAFTIPAYPTLHFNWGSAKKRDHTIELSLSGQISFATKYQLFNQEDKRRAMAIRPQFGIGTYPILTDGQQLWAKVPLIYTKEFAKKSSITISPGYIFSIPGNKVGKGTKAKFQKALFFTSFTYHYGKKNRFFVSLSIVNVKQTLQSKFDPSNQLAFGYIWRWKKKTKHTNPSM